MLARQMLHQLSHSISPVFTFLNKYLQWFPAASWIKANLQALTYFLTFSHTIYQEQTTKCELITLSHSREGFTANLCAHHGMVQKTGKHNG
jgi:hypothetical protein